MELREVLAALRATWWLPLLGMILGGGAALGVSLSQSPLYTSYTQLFVSATGSTTTSDALQGSQFTQQRVSSYAHILASEELAGRVIDRLDLDMAPGELTGEVSASAVPETVLIDVVVTDPSPERAQELAQALGAEFRSYVSELETPEGGTTSPVKVTVTNPPGLSAEPSSPQTVRNVALGLLAGLVLGAALAILRARLDRTVKDAEQVSALTGVPVIGTVLRDETLGKRHTIDRGIGSRTAEDFRQLRTNLQFLNIDDPPTVIMVSSAVPSEGKTTLVINLGLALSDAGRRVTIVEADLRRPKVTSYLDMVAGVGLTNILAGTAEIEEVTQTYRDGLLVIAAGQTPPNPGELLGSSHMAAVIDKLRGQNDFVLVDAPPVLPVADASALAGYMDGVLLSVRYGSTRKDQLQQTVSTIERVGAKTLGVVLNIVPPRSEGASAYGYGYSYGYDAKHADR